MNKVVLNVATLNVCMMNVAGVRSHVAPKKGVSLSWDDGLVLSWDDGDEILCDGNSIYRY